MIVAETASMIDVLQQLREVQADIALVSRAPTAATAADITGVVTAAEISSALKDAAVLQ